MQRYNILPKWIENLLFFYLYQFLYSIGNGVWSRVYTDERLASNCSIIENIPPKGVGFSYFIAIFAIPDQFQLTIQ